MDVRKQASPASDNATPMAGHQHSQIMGARLSEGWSEGMAFGWSEFGSS